MISFTTKPWTLIGLTKDGVILDIRQTDRLGKAKFSATDDTYIVYAFLPDYIFTPLEITVDAEHQDFSLTPTPDTIDTGYQTLTINCAIFGEDDEIPEGATIVMELVNPPYPLFPKVHAIIVPENGVVTFTPNKGAEITIKFIGRTSTVPAYVKNFIVSNADQANLEDYP